MLKELTKLLSKFFANFGEITNPNFVKRGSEKKENKHCTPFFYKYKDGAPDH